MNKPDWLPEPLNYDDYKGDWEKFVEDAYDIFIRDFYHNPTFYGNNRVSIDHTQERGKEKTFWHIVEGSKAGEIDWLDMKRRYERIGWPKPIIINHQDSKISVWQNVRRRKTRILFWFESIEGHGYLVVIERIRKGEHFIVTAYPTDRPHTRRWLIDDRNASLKSSKRRP